MNFLDEDEELNPILSVANLVDVFLVLIAALLISIASNPLNPYNSESVTVVKNAGQPDMELIVKDGERIMRYESSNEIGSGEGARAGIAYRMNDGSIIYVPDDAEKNNAENQP